MAKDDSIKYVKGDIPPKELLESTLLKLQLIALISSHNFERACLSAIDSLNFS